MLSIPLNKPFCAYIENTLAITKNNFAKNKSFTNTFAQSERKKENKKNKRIIVFI